MCERSRSPKTEVATGLLLSFKIMGLLLLLLLLDEAFLIILGADV